VPVKEKIKKFVRLVIAGFLVAMIAAVLMMSSPVSVSMNDGGIASVALATGDGDSSTGKPAYQVMIPNGAGNETGLQVFPPKLQADEREDNWLSVSHPYKDVTVGEYTYDDEGDCIAVDPSKGDIYVRETDSVLVITAGTLSDKCEYDIEVVDYTLYGGETVWDEERQNDTVQELRARFRDYVYGSGSDLYQLEDVPQKDGLAHIDSIQKVSVYAYVKAQDGATKATASTRIMLGGDSYNGTDIALDSSEQRIVTEYSTNPNTNKPWLWSDINDLQAGITLKYAECSFVYVEVKFLVHSQTFFPIDPVEVTPGTAGAWTDVDVSSYTPEGATGVILHIVNTSTGTNYPLGIRKNGSTDDRRYVGIYYGSHLWAATGVDGDRIFEAYVQDTGYIDIYLVGYTMSGVTFFTNGYDKTLADDLEWLDIDCSAEAPDAVGLIFEGYATAGKRVGFRKNGSSDDRTSGYSYYHLWTMIGCDDSQVCEGYVQHTIYKFFLTGYITDGCTFNTNATDVSLDSTGSWQDLPALPDNSVMGFIEAIASVGADYGLRKNGSSEEIYEMAAYHPWAFVGCDADGIIEGKIGDTAVEFFVVGYAAGPSPPTNDSLAFTNPYAGNQAVADDATEWTFRAKVTDVDGPDNIDYVLLRLANSSDDNPPYDALKFKWTQSSDTFSKEADIQNCATLASTPSDSSSSGNQWTLDFKIKFNSNFSTQTTDYNAELYTLDDDSASDEDTYSNFYQVIPVPTIDITAPDNISGWNLTPTGSQPLTQGGTMAVEVTPDSMGWSATAKDLDTDNTNGFMTEWDGSYGSAQLGTAMQVQGPDNTVTLPNGGGTAIATGTGDNPSISITFKQTVLWSDEIKTYRIVVTFIGSTS
jgi:hypothetical protein